jgi:hypothetical protein
VPARTFDIMVKHVFGILDLESLVSQRSLSYNNQMAPLVSQSPWALYLELLTIVWF